MVFFTIMHPLSNLPAYIFLETDDDQMISKRIAGKSLTIAFVIIAVVVLTEHAIFSLDILLFAGFGTIATAITLFQGDWEYRILTLTVFCSFVY
ncbi:hypothetical protein ScFU53_11040 [Streptococcus canis]|uniref:MarC membrane protein n=1 Tax=Streptococcus canis FSL Z3-227 TaxID=482234 RepID=A0AAV3FV09_STRCB|nr:MarC membrane protein [Streptococcus canis FSL Z3-227]VEE24454.1 MarC membrane protein [Streptococcus canis]VTS75633.1 MarC membrane protein [Streptococcus canis]GAY71021.1 MarC membrane protein [Streptococcus canis]GEE07545.1 hypothetical protein ScOT1_16380 [Streptococcus canis]